MLVEIRRCAYMRGLMWRALKGAHHGGEVLPQLRIIWHGLLVRIILVSVAVMDLCRVAIFRRAGCRGWIIAVAGPALVGVRLLVER